MKHSKPYKFQREDMPKLEPQGRAILGYEPGLGKTFQALWFCERNVKGMAVVVCPAGLKEHWRREARKHFGWPAYVLSGKRPYRLPRRKKCIYIVNYDILGVPSRNIPTWTEELKKLKPELLIVDEGHYVKEESSQRTKAVMDLKKIFKYRLVLTGTAIVNRPIEIFTLLRIVRPQMYPSRFEFGCEYCALIKYRGKWDYSGHSNLEELNKELTESGVFLRRRKVDVLKDLPPKTRTVVPFDLDGKARKEYNFAVEDFLGWLRTKNRAAAHRASYAEMFVRTNYLKRLAAELKYQQVVEWIEDFLQDSDEKLVVFGVHQKILQPLHEKFMQTSVLVDGRVTGAKRQNLIDQFNNDKSKRLFIGNIIAAGVGWSCQSASNVAFIELDWVPGNHMQAEDRPHGIGRGTGKPLNIYYLVANDTIELDLCDVLEKKQRVIAQTLDGKKVADFNLMSLVVERLQQRIPKKRKRA